MHPAYEYSGDDDMTREVPERLTKEAVFRRLSAFFVGGTQLRSSGMQQPYSLGNPRPAVSFGVTTLLCLCFSVG